jgi:hypothetical protein
MKLYNIFNERKEQLEKQELIDTKLKKMSCICPTVVSDYLLLQRDITRNQQLKIINTNLLFIYDEMNKQLKINQSIANRIININLNCAELKRIVNEGSKYL